MLLLFLIDEGWKEGRRRIILVLWGIILRGNSFTILRLQKVLNQVLHQAVLLGHIPLEVDHLVENVLVIVLEIADVGSHVLLRALHPVDFDLKGFNRGRVVWR